MRYAVKWICLMLGSAGTWQWKLWQSNSPTPTSSFASEIAALSERDFDGDGVLTFSKQLCQLGTYEPSTAPSTCVDADAGHFVTRVKPLRHLVLSAPLTRHRPNIVR